MDINDFTDEDLVEENLNEEISLVQEEPKDISLEEEEINDEIVVEDFPVENIPLEEIPIEPEGPESLLDPKYQVYVPKATTYRPGIASYNNKHFMVSPKGKVSLIVDLNDIKEKTDTALENSQEALETSSEAKSIAEEALEQVIIGEGTKIYEDGVLQGSINVDKDIQEQFNDIYELIPEQASSENQLVDKNFVDSNKMDKTNPTGTGSFSLNRKSNTTIGDHSFAEGYETEASGFGCHAEGWDTAANASFASHAEGTDTDASGDYSHAEGDGTDAIGEASHAEGYRGNAIGDYSHAEGYQTDANGDYSHSEGGLSYAGGIASHAEGSFTNSDGSSSHAEGYSTIASGDYSHAEGIYTEASAEGSHVEGHATKASGDYSHAEGAGAVASGDISHAEGGETEATGTYSHAEGLTTEASGYASHAEGQDTDASGDYSHAEGYNADATGAYGSHAEGYNTIASGNWGSHAEGRGTEAHGYASHAEGRSTIATRLAHHVFGAFNIIDNQGVNVAARGKYIEIVGNGSDANTRSNARTIDWDGNEEIAGKHHAIGGYTDGNNNSYVAELPNTSGWVKNHTFAMTDIIPIGMIAPFYLTTVPSGWLECNGGTFSSTDYPLLYAALGTTTLPDLRNRFIEGANGSGQYKQSVSAGLPNLQGSFYIRHMADAGSAMGGSDSNLFSYVMKDSSTPTWQYGVAREKVSNYQDRFSFNAQNNNNIYGGSSTVQPKSVRMMYCIKASY